MGKLKKVRIVLIGFLIYVFIGVVGFLLIKNVYKPSNY